jgi:signal transduction histidine kinase
MLDVSAHARVEKALREAKQTAEEANAAKNVFLANVSHEIRTPMHGIIGMSDLLLKESHPAETHRRLSLILRSAQSLLVIIDEILDISKIEAGRFQLFDEAFDLLELLEQVHAPFALPAAAKELVVSLRVGPGVPRWVTGDPVRLRQVLVNLMGNAVKFTERGQVMLTAHLAAAGEPGDPLGVQRPQPPAPGQRVALRFAISDTGIGIAEEKLEIIFGTFAQADGSITRRFGGTGLGLAISSHLVRLMGGSIAVKSREGVGSVFHFTIDLPAALPPEVVPAAAAPSAAAGPRPLHILVAEDQPINQEFAAQALRTAGHTIALASNGQEAVEALDRGRFDRC